MGNMVYEIRYPSPKGSGITVHIESCRILSIAVFPEVFRVLMKSLNRKP